MELSNNLNMDNVKNNSKYEYFAFISYKREDEKWAKWLQKKLESYGFPVTLRKDNPSLPAKIRPIFRDQSELSGGNLKEEIEKGLKGSKYLIVICSPRSAQSPWVSKEVQYFFDNGKENNIIPFIIGGSPNAKNPEEECFPEGLRKLSGEKEILGISINEMGRDAAAIKVIARMFNLRFDTLWQRHERAKRRKRLVVMVGVVAIAFFGFLLAVVMASLKNEADQQKQKALEQTLIAQRERERANIEGDRANEHANIAKKQTEIAQKEQDNALKANQNLIESNRQLAKERENVLKANWKMMENRARVVAEKANQLIDAGDIYRAIALLLEVMPSPQNLNIPYVGETEKILRIALDRLNRDGYVSIANIDSHSDRASIELGVVDIKFDKKQELIGVMYTSGEGVCTINTYYLKNGGLCHSYTEESADYNQIKDYFDLVDQYPLISDNEWLTNNNQYLLKYSRGNLSLLKNAQIKYFQSL